MSILLKIIYSYFVFVFLWIDGQFRVPEPEYLVKGVRFRYVKPRSGTQNLSLKNYNKNITI